MNFAEYGVGFVRILLSSISGDALWRNDGGDSSYPSFDVAFYVGGDLFSDVSDIREAKYRPE